MKNIHILPTDKPSRLRYFDSKLEIMSLIPKKSDIVFQNIYITSDEEIKAGDKILNPTNEVQTCIGLEKGIGTDNICWIKVKETTTLQQILNSQKIILTTDQDLIANGVQAIDDDFLEWFVNNSNCEEVKVELHEVSFVVTDNIYKIIIPKEEPKIDSIFNEANVRFSETLDKLSDNSLKQETTFEEDEIIDISDHDGIGNAVDNLNNEPPQETLEEVAENAFVIFQNENPIVPQKHILPFKLGYIKGAKWQAERMYSEEDLREAFKSCYTPFSFDRIGDLEQDFNKWFEQFKKK
jgi:hypothetical protein